MSWVETQVPCMLYCGPDLCNCPAFYYYEALEEDEDWSIADKKELAEKRAYEKYLTKLRDYSGRESPAAVAVKSRETFMSWANETVSVLK